MAGSPPRGFTLIELLVVIAIIGILSSVVLASLVLARLKAADAGVKNNIHTIQTQMELVYDTYDAYGSTSPLSVQSSPTSVIGGTSAFKNDLQVQQALVGALTAGGSGCWAVGQNQKTYAVAVPLKADSGYWWCADSTGVAKKVTASTFTGDCNSGGTMKGGASSAAACP